MFINKYRCIYTYDIYDIYANNFVSVLYNSEFYIIGSNSFIR